MKEDPIGLLKKPLGTAWVTIAEGTEASRI